MNFPVFIARRYLFSKKSNNVINIISRVATIGVAVGTMALIIVLSVFNGFEQLVISLFNSFNPDLQVTLAEGKTIDYNDIPVEEIKKIDGVIHFTEIVEENALIRYKNRQDIVTIKGVGSEYEAMSGLDSMIIDGNFELEYKQKPNAVIGAGIAYTLGLNIRDFANPLSIYVPKRGKQVSVDPTKAFNTNIIMPSGVFSVQQEFDVKYVIVPIAFARQLLDYTNEITSFEIGVKSGANVDRIQTQLEKLLGDKFIVKNRFQQQEMLYKIMKSEKWAIFLILSFILVIATFNVIGSLSMLIIEKKKDISIIWSMGANLKTIKRIFLIEGIFVTLLGAFVGVFLGSIICWLQQTFGLVKLQASGSFVVSAYPVRIELFDIAMVVLVVIAIGLATSWYPVRQISKRNLIRINQ